MSMFGQSIPCKKFDMSIRVPKDALTSDDWNKRWIPPKAGQFTELTKEDEFWAKDLGLGAVVDVRIEPIVLKFQARLDDLLYRELFKNTETGIFGKCQIQSAATAANL